MNLTGERILQAQRTATQTTLTKIPYYKFSCVLKLLESLVKRYPYIKHTHQIWGYVLFTFLPQYIRMLPFMTNWSALDRIFLIFAKLMFWFSFLSLLAILCQFSFLFFANNRLSVGVSKYISVKVVITQPNSLPQSKAGKHHLCCAVEFRIELSPKQWKSFPKITRQMVAKQEKVLSQEILLPGLLDWIDFGDKRGNLKVDGLWFRSCQIQT